MSTDALEDQQAVERLILKGLSREDAVKRVEMFRAILDGPPYPRWAIDGLRAEIDG